MITKDQLKALPANVAKEMLVSMGDLLDGSSDQKFDPDELKARIAAEMVRASHQIANNPLRAVKIAAVSGVVFFIAGAATYMLLLCKAC